MPLPSLPSLFKVGSKKDHKEEPASNVPKALMSSEQLAKKRDELLEAAVDLSQPTSRRKSTELYKQPSIAAPNSSGTAPEPGRDLKHLISMGKHLVGSHEDDSASCEGPDVVGRDIPASSASFTSGSGLRQLTPAQSKSLRSRGLQVPGSVGNTSIRGPPSSGNFDTSGNLEVQARTQSCLILPPRPSSTTFMVLEEATVDAPATPTSGMSSTFFTSKENLRTSGRPVPPDVLASFNASLVPAGVVTAAGVRSGLSAAQSPTTTGTLFPMGPDDVNDPCTPAFAGDTGGRSPFMLNLKGNRSFQARSNPTPLASAGGSMQLSSGPLSQDLSQSRTLRSSNSSIMTAANITSGPSTSSGALNARAAAMAFMVPHPPAPPSVCDSTASADPASNLKRAIAGAAPGLRRNSMTYDERTGAMVPVPGASSKPPVPPNMSAVIRSRRSLESATPVPPSSAGSGRLFSSGDLESPVGTPTPQLSAAQAWAPRDVNTPPSPLVSGSHDIMPPAPSSTEYSGNRPSGLASGGGSGSRNLKSALSMASNNGQPQLWMGSSSTRRSIDSATVMSGSNADSARGPVSSVGSMVSAHADILSIRGPGDEEMVIASRSSKSLEISRNLAVLQSDDPSLFAPPNASAVKGGSRKLLHQATSTATVLAQRASVTFRDLDQRPASTMSVAESTATSRTSLDNTSVIDDMTLLSTPDPSMPPSVPRTPPTPQHPTEDSTTVGTAPRTARVSRPLWHEARAAMSFLQGSREGLTTAASSVTSSAAGLFGNRNDPISKLMHAPDARTFEAVTAESRINKVQPGGVSLRYLFKLDDALMSMSQGVMTTRQVVEQILMPRTAEHQCRFIELASPVYRSEAKAFIIHAWDGDFHAMVAQLRRYAWEQGIDPCTHHIWIDILCSNLHTTTFGPRDLSNVKDIIRSCKQVILVMDAMATPLTRTWCWYEMWAALALEPQSTFVCPTDRLHMVAYDVDWSHVAGVLYEARVEMTAASNPSDVQRLLYDIKYDRELKMPDATKLGPSLVAGLLEAVCAEVRAAERMRLASPRMYASANCKHALMLCMMGRYWEAEKAVRALLLENSKHENLKQVDVARVTAGLAVLAEEQGFHDEAHRLLDTALETYEALPDASPATGGAGEGVDESEVKTKAAQARCISARATLAYVLFSQGQLPECERMCQEVIEAHQLEGFGASNGNDALVPDRSYITVLRLMAHLRAKGKQVERGLKFAQEAVSLAERHLHPEHMDTLEARVQLALMLQSANRPEQALPVLDTALMAEQALHGKSGRNALVLQALRTVCLLEDGKLEWATELVKTLPGLLEAGHHTADTKYEAPTGRYVPSHEPGPQMSLRSTPCAAVSEALEFVRDAWVERSKDKALELGAEDALKAALTLQYSIRALSDTPHNKDMARNLQRELANVLRKQGKVLDTKQWPA